MWVMLASKRAEKRNLYVSEKNANTNVLDPLTVKLSFVHPRKLVDKHYE